METRDLRQQYVKSRRGLLEVLEAQRAGGMISDHTYRRLSGALAGLLVP
ncbi:MAG: hypothetical protein HY558_06745 [Euryarchaeota archaeon]|nr:hypothetical protein [Euryarchaeota archaeon]